MYYLTGLQANLDTIATVSKVFIDENFCPGSLDSFKRAYRSFTRHIQPAIPESSDDDILFVGDCELLDKLIALFVDMSPGKGEIISGCSFDKIYDVNVTSEKYRLVKHAIDDLSKNSPEINFLFNFLFSYVFLIQSDSITCATIPKAMGILLLDHKYWSTADLCEMIVHETTHQLVTLDEYRYGYYSDTNELSRTENFAISAMRTTNRPLNKVIHSLLVAYEIVAYRKALDLPDAAGVHPSTSVIQEQIKRTISSINGLENIDVILTSRSMEIINLVESRLEMSQ